MCILQLKHSFMQIFELLFIVSKIVITGEQVIHYHTVEIATLIYLKHCRHYLQYALRGSLRYVVYFCLLLP